MDRPLSPETLCNHPAFEALPSDNRPLTPPIYQSVKFTVDDFQELKKIFRGDRTGFFYSRASNPSCAVLEELLAKLQKTDAARTTATGIAAITCTLLGLLESGDRLIYFIESYSPSRLFAEGMLKKFGVEPVRLSMHDHQAIEEELSRPKTKAILFESVSNPLLQVPPFEKIYRKSQEHQVITILDNTFAGFQSWDAWPFDIYLHSLTKYASGHGDVMGGVIMGRRELIKQVDKSLMMLGAALDPHAAFLIQRGMKTYHLRRKEQCANALSLAHWLSDHPKLEQVVYPGLPSHPQHSLFKEHFDDFGTMIYLRFKNKTTNAEELVTRGKIFQLAGSLGSTESLIAPALFFFGSDLNAKERELTGIGQGALRLSIGIENIEDLRDDLVSILEFAP